MSTIPPKRSVLGVPESTSIQQVIPSDRFRITSGHSPNLVSFESFQLWVPLSCKLGACNLSDMPGFLSVKVSYPLQCPRETFTQGNSRYPSQKFSSFFIADESAVYVPF